MALRVPSAAGLAVATLLLAAVPAVAGEFKAGTLTIGDPWTRATAPSARAGGGFMTITNQGKEPDRLLSAESPVAGKLEIHESTIDSAGVMRMRELPQGLPIPPGTAADLKPGGNHIMLMGLREPLVAGTSVPLTLIFERAGAVRVELAVQGPGATGANAGHGTGHGGPSVQP